MQSEKFGARETIQSSEDVYAAENCTEYPVRTACFLSQAGGLDASSNQTPCCRIIGKNAKRELDCTVQRSLSSCSVQRSLDGGKIAPSKLTWP